METSVKMSNHSNKAPAEAKRRLFQRTNPCLCTNRNWWRKADSWARRTAGLLWQDAEFCMRIISCRNWENNFSQGQGGCQVRLRGKEARVWGGDKGRKRARQHKGPQARLAKTDDKAKGMWGKKCQRGEGSGNEAEGPCSGISNWF